MPILSIRQIEIRSERCSRSEESNERETNRSGGWRGALLAGLAWARTAGVPADFAEHSVKAETRGSDSQ